MATKSSGIVLASALCFLSLLGFAYCADNLSVDGLVYCDNCRIQFMTRISEPLKGTYGFPNLSTVFDTY